MTLSDDCRGRVKEEKAPKVLVIEDSAVYQSMICDAIRSRLDFATDSARSYSETRRLIGEPGAHYFAAVIDRVLPDANDGEVVDFVLERRIPTVVLTETYNDDVREQLMNKGIVDYNIKEGRHGIDLTVTVLQRLYTNDKIGVLVVDDSRFYRRYLRGLLVAYRYDVFEAADGESASKALQSNPHIKIVITDYDMPGMGGFELTRRLRQQCGSDVAIIGLSSSDQRSLSARFLKCGANDFLAKSFCREEFYCRVTQNVDAIERAAQLRDASIRDYLTGLYNRRYLFEASQLMYSNAKRHELSMAVAILDVDDFKMLNDEYGHEAGDAALVHLANILSDRLRKTDVVSRFGGEEFCLILSNSEPDAVAAILDALRDEIERTPLARGAQQLAITVSIGASCRLSSSFKEMIIDADRMLYKAKESGKNRVEMHLPECSTEHLSGPRHRGVP